MIGPKVVFSVFRAGLRSLSPIAKYPLCDAVDVRTVEDQQFDPDDVTGQSPDGDAAAEAVGASVETQPHVGYASQRPGLLHARTHQQ
jgi:hypothetical protein